MSRHRQFSASGERTAPNQLQLFNPAELRVVEHVRRVYSCRRCEKNKISRPVATAPMPAPVIKGSLASPTLMAHIMMQKYVYAMPLYRQEQRFSLMGAELSRQTPANRMP